MKKIRVRNNDQRSHVVSRRAFLGGAGVAVALPFLPSMMRGSRVLAEDSICTVPKRMIAWYVPNGIHMAAWTPAGRDRAWELTTILAPLAPVKDDVQILTGLANRPAQPDGPGDHASGTGAFFTAAHPYKTEGSDIRNGISVDQVAAGAIGSCTRFPSLQLGIEGGSSAGGCDSGYSCAYARNISWADTATPLPKIVNPQVVFDRLFGGFDPAATREQIERRRLYQSSVLDYALDEATSLRGRLGTTDRYKLDEYLNAVREVELRVSSAGAGPVCDVPDRPPSDLPVTEHIRVMADLQVLAMQCDLTRIITFMMANAGSGRSYDFLGVSGGHHEISHHGGSSANHDKLTIIDTWEVEQLSYMLQRMKEVVEPDGSTLLDNSVLFFSSEISDGDRHNHTDMPIVLAGGAGGYFDTGRHVVYESERTVADLFISMLASVGVVVDSFGDDGTAALM